MDIILNFLDQHVLTPYVYPLSWKEDDPLRQSLSLFVIMNLGGYFMYFFFATISFYFIFDHRLLKHPQILENQIRKEIITTVTSVPFMAVPTTLIFFLEVRGYSKLYDNLEDSKFGFLGIVFSIIAFILFTDMLIYWIHRGLHHKAVYKTLHKMHHKWKIPTPFASHAFHPIDGFVQSLPYHIYPFLFPLHKYAYLGLFVFVNFWTISIHDGDYRVPGNLQTVINGGAHHTDHHTLYNYNYGQFLTFWDRFSGTYHHPNAYKGDSPLDQILRKTNKGQNGKVRAAEQTDMNGINARENGDAKKVK